MSVPAHSAPPASPRRERRGDAVRPERVAVVGTGVVGLAAALGCAQRGLRVRLIGPTPRFFEAGEDVPGPIGGGLPARFDPRIYAISEGSRRLLTDCKVWAQIDPTRLCPVSRMQVAGDAGGHLRFDAYASCTERLATIGEESTLLRALWLGCAMTPGIEHVPLSFRAATFDGGGTTRIELADGEDGAATQIECDLLIGADGKHSPVRAAAGISAHGTPYGHTAFVANFACEHPHDGIAYQWFTPDEGIVALLPLPGNHVSLVWSAPDALAPQLTSLPLPEFQERVAQRSAGILGALETLGDRHAFPLRRLIVDRLVRPGLALMGDAAHVVHPLAGQGLNLGLQDVADLLRRLDTRESWRSIGDLVLLRRYERARAEPLAVMRGAVGALATLFAAPDTTARRLRNAGLSLIDSLPPIKNALVRHAMG